MSTQDTKPFSSNHFFFKHPNNLNWSGWDKYIVEHNITTGEAYNLYIKALSNGEFKSVGIKKPIELQTPYYKLQEGNGYVFFKKVSNPVLGVVVQVYHSSKQNCTSHLVYESRAR